MRSFWTAVGMIGLFATAAWAQIPSDARPNDRPGAQRRAAAGESGPARPAAIFERLGKQLDLDQAQQIEYDKLVAAYREKLAAQRQGQAEAAELVRKMRDARQAGDDEQVRQLREQMRSRRSSAGRDVMQSFFDDVEKFLRDDQKEKLGQLREQSASQGPRGERGPRPFVAPERQIALLRDRLELTDEQRAKFDALAGELRQKLSADGQPSIADLMQQLREAYVANDREEAARLRKSVGERRVTVEKALGEFAAQLEPSLTDSQKESFANYREELVRGMGPRAAGDAQALRGDPRMLLRAVKRLDLSQEQKDQVRAIEADATRQLRAAGRDGAAGVRADLEKQVRAILTPDQVTQLDSILERQRKNGDRVRRGAGAAGPPGQRKTPTDESP